MVDNNNGKILLTKQGLKNLQDEYDRLAKKRPQIVERVEEARQQGDLKENAEYQTSREELTFIDGRLEELKSVLERAVVAEQKNNCQEVALGCKVTVGVNDDKHAFHLVGEWEADPAERKISHQSPLGQALMGRKTGDEVEVEVPAGKLSYKILSID